MLFVGIAFADEAGNRLYFKVSPNWTVSGAWASDGSLVLADPFAKELLHYSIPPPGSSARAELVGKIGKAQGLGWPSLIESMGTGFLVEDEPGTFVQLDSTLKPRRRVDVLGDSKSARHQLGAIYGWRRMGTDYLIAFADIQNADGSWQSAFVRVPLSNPAQFKILKTMGLSDPARSFYLLGYPYVAALGNVGYFLVMAPRPYIVEVAPDGSTRDLPPLSFRAGRRPSLPEKQGSSSMPEIFQKLEGVETPAGLYGDAGNLYLLMRRPGSGGETEWLLQRIDTQTAKVVNTVRLGTSANHLTVITGPTWGFVEKRAVEKSGLQQIPSVLLLTREDLKKLGS